MDEAHLAVAPTYKWILDSFNAARGGDLALLGLSATPGRSAGQEETKQLADLFFSNKVSLEIDGYKSPVDFLQEQGYLSKPTYEYINFDDIGSSDLHKINEREIADTLEVPDWVLKALGTNEKRNLLILKKIIDNAKPGNKVIVFACSVEHANILSNLLCIKGFKAAAISSQTENERRRIILESFKEETGEINILTNYDILTTGFDAPKVNIAVIARPTKSVALYSQMIGRAIRGPKAGGNCASKIITVIDKIPGYSSVAEGFEFWNDIWETK
jgi:superfamily II DNA or RNA helicase